MALPQDMLEGHHDTKDLYISTIRGRGTHLKTLEESNSYETTVRCKAERYSEEEGPRFFACEL